MPELRDASSLLADLLSFEAAARLGSFSRAAEALGVSQPAVSLRVRQLEKRLGARLFARGGRGVTLTTDGLSLWRDAQSGLDQLLDAVGAIQRRRKRRDSLAITVSSAFASYWLLPRMRRFQEKFPTIDLRIVTADQPLDLVAEGIPLAVRYGDGGWTEYESWKLASEIVVPVCSPHYLQRHGSVHSLEHLAKHRLIDLHERRLRHLGWREWLKAAGTATERVSNRLDFTDYALVVKAAMAGDGIALGWQHLVGDLLLDGHLVVPIPRMVVTGNSYWVIAPRGVRPPSAVIRLRDWLLSEAQLSERRYADWRRRNLIEKTVSTMRVKRPRR
jgi:LysR family transcriptional regulator, glycine cleavage system transcriptional activator